MTSFPGFSPGTRSVPVPSPLLGPLLEEITDVAELKCTLRFLWHLAQRRGQPRAVPASVLLNDDVLLASLGSGLTISQGFRAAVGRGTLLTASIAITPGGSREPAYLLHTPENRRLADSDKSGPQLDGPLPQAGPPDASRPNIFVLYEENVGTLTPMVADELRDAETVYPWVWIKDAFREAVNSNKRSWRYISRILERWSTEGRGHGADGEPGRDTKALTAAEYLQRYGLPGGRRDRGE